MPDFAEYPELVLPIYSYAEADRLAAVSPGTTKRWLEGYKYRRDAGDFVPRPPISSVAETHEAGAVSFVDLVEVYAINGLREWFSPQKIRDIVSDCAEVFGTRYPLASHVFETDGREIFVRKEGRLVGILGRKWEIAWQSVLQPFLHQLDYRGELAARWHPMGKGIPVVIDPEYGFGLPVVEGTGFRTEIIAERFEHQLEEEIARELGIPVLQVQRALQFEVSR